MVAVPDCDMESVLPLKLKGAETVVVCATPVELVERIVAGRAETVRLEVEAVPKKPVPETVRAVVEA